MIGAFNRLVTICMGLLLACAPRDRLLVDVDPLPRPLEVVRLERLIEPGTTTTDSQLTALASEHGFLVRCYLRDIVQVGDTGSPMVDARFNAFLADPSVAGAQRAIARIYNSDSAWVTDLNEAFAYHLHYFPESPVPRLFTYNSGFNVGIYPADTLLGIGLEWYVGADADVVKLLPPETFPLYVRERMNPDYLSVNAMRGWLLVHYQNHLKGETLLDHLIFYGKIHYLLRACMPYHPAELRFNYTEEELTWCRKNAYNIWSYLIDQKLLYTNDLREINKLVSDGPFTPGMPQESPSRVGIWLGAQLVEAYMQAHPETALPALLHIHDQQAFLKSYKPKSE